MAGVTDGWRGNLIYVVEPGQVDGDDCQLAAEERPKEQGMKKSGRVQHEHEEEVATLEL